MARNFSPMYCSLDAIDGMHEEKHRAELLFRNHLRGAAGIIVLALEDPEWVYGQATFPHEHGQPFKFVDRFSTVVSNRVLDVLVAEGEPSAILFVDTSLKARFEHHQAFVRVRSLFRQVTEFRAEPQTGGFFSRIRRSFARAVDPIVKGIKAENRLNPVKIYTDSLMRSETLPELLMSVAMLYLYCSLDKAQEILEARVRAKPEDVVAHTGLTLLLSDFGDHTAALAQARKATELVNPPSEAFLWRAKEAWWAEETAEGLVALSRIQSPPAHWPRIAHRGMEAVRAALLAQEGKHAAAAQAIESAIEIDGSDYALHLCLAHELQAAGRFDDAQTAVDNAGVVSPNNPLVLVERCRILEARGQTDALNRALRTLCKSDRGRLEARRFAASDGIEEVEFALPERFASLDTSRHHALCASILPTWFQLCEDSPEDWIRGLMSVINAAGLERAHRGDQEFGTRLSAVFYHLRRDPLDSAGHFAAAYVWRKLNRPNVASEWGRSAVALAPDVDLNHLVHAKALRDAEEHDKAFDAAALAVELGKADDETVQIYVQLLWSIPRLDVMARWTLTPSLKEELCKAAQRHLDDPALRPAALMALSLVTYHDDIAKAIDLQKEALQLAPDHEAYHAWHVEILESLGRDDETAAALEAQAAAIRRRDPGLNAEAFASFADTMVDLKNHKAAYVLVRAGLQLAPDLTELLVAQGRVLLALGRHDEAFGVLRKAAFSDFASAGRAARLLGAGLSEAGRREEAIEIWRRLQTLEPENAAGFLCAGIDLWNLGRDTEAADMVARSVELDDSDPYAWGLLGRMRWTLGQLDESLHALERALTFERPPRHALRSLTTTLRVLGADHPHTLATDHSIAWTGQTEDAREALRLCKELLPDQQWVPGPNHPHTFATRNNIATWTADTGDTRDALRLAKELLSDVQRVCGADHPNTLKSRGHIAAWTKGTGDEREALRLFKELLPDQQRVLGPDHLYTRATRTFIAELEGESEDWPPGEAAAVTARAAVTASRNAPCPCGSGKRYKHCCGTLS